jgi:hypothetical protein
MAAHGRTGYTSEKIEEEVPLSICRLTVRLRGRPLVVDQSRGRTSYLGARGDRAFIGMALGVIFCFASGAISVGGFLAARRASKLEHQLSLPPNNRSWVP